MKKLKQMYRCIEELKYRNSKTTGCPTKTFGHDRRCGFTLVELVIVIAIVIILSVISVPIYRGYVDKAKWAEAYALVGTIASAQKAYYAEHGNFLCSSVGFTNYEATLGVDARGNKYFTKFEISLNNGVFDTKYECAAVLEKPEELKNNANRYLYSKFNITTGSTFWEANW